MIISKEVKVKSSKYYKDLQYDITDKYIVVDIKHLPLGSSFIIDVKCDYCDLNRTISYKYYNKNISKGGKFSCSIKCGSIKAKESNLEKYGVDSVSKLESVKLKTKNTTIKKYGVDHISKIESISEQKSIKMKLKSSEISERIKKFNSELSEECKLLINEKRIKTIFDKYGFSNISQVDSIKNKVKETVNEKYGGFTYQSDELMLKVKETNLERYGFEISSKNEDIKNKTYLTNIERWGFKSPSINNEVKAKSISKNLERYGVENIMFLPIVVKNLNDKLYDKYKVNSYFKTDEFRNSIKYNPIGNDIFRKNLIISNHKNYIRYIDNNMSEFNCDYGESHVFLISSINFHNRNNSNIGLCTVCCPIGEQKSIKEKELLEFIKSIYTGNVVSSYRDGLEIDIYLPELKIGFEFNGLYWHSEKFKEKNYHLNKTNYFKEKGIRIIHIWEDDWDNRKEIIRSQIRNLVESSTDKIYARKCSIRNVDQLEYKNFLNNNHMQGFIRSKIRIGLFHDDELVSLMTFDNLEGRKKMEDGGWNLSRFCSIMNTNVIGGSSKLLKYFIKEYKPSRIISFADLDWSLGDLYYKLGFNLSNISKPDYKYVNNDNRLNKQRFTKNKLAKLGYDISKTESQITKEIGLSKIYSCGQLKFELLIN